MSQLSSIEFNFCDVSQQEQFSNTVPLTQQIAFIATSEDEARVLNARLNTVWEWCSMIVAQMINGTYTPTANMFISVLGLGADIESKLALLGIERIGNFRKLTRASLTGLIGYHGLTGQDVNAINHALELCYIPLKDPQQLGVLA